MICFILIKIVFKSHLFVAQTRAALLMPRPHDYLLLEHLVAGEASGAYYHTHVLVDAG
jgi:hypothetical protein